MGQRTEVELGVQPSVFLRLLLNTETEHVLQVFVFLQVETDVNQELLGCHAWEEEFTLLLDFGGLGGYRVDAVEVLCLVLGEIEQFLLPVVFDPEDVLLLVFRGVQTRLDFRLLFFQLNVQRRLEFLWNVAVFVVFVVFVVFFFLLIVCLVFCWNQIWIWIWI